VKVDPLRRVKTPASTGGVCSGGVDSPPEPADVSAMLKQVHLYTRSRHIYAIAMDMGLPTGMMAKLGQNICF